MKSFKQLLNELTPQHWTPERLANAPTPAHWSGRNTPEEIAVHQADRLAKKAAKNSDDKKKGKISADTANANAMRIAALGRAISVPARATDAGEVELAHTAPDPFGKPGERVAVSGGSPLTPGKITRHDFRLPERGMQSASNSAATVRNLSKLARASRGRRLASVVEVFQGTQSECMKMCLEKMKYTREECEKRWCTKSSVTIKEAAKRSLSRLRQHIEDGHMVGLISASRGNLPTRENNARTKQLMSSLRKHGYTPIAVSGEYVEDHNGERIPVREKSFMIHSGSLGAGHPEWSPDSLHREFISDLKKHGEMFGQDTVLSVSKKHGSVFHGTGESTWVPKGKRTRIGGSELQAGAGVEKSDFKSRLAGRPFLMGGGS